MSRSIKRANSIHIRLAPLTFQQYWRWLGSVKCVASVHSVSIWYCSAIFLDKFNRFLLKLSINISQVPPPNELPTGASDTTRTTFILAATCQQSRLLTRLLITSFPNYVEQLRLIYLHDKFWCCGVDPTLTLKNISFCVTPFCNLF